MPSSLELYNSLGRETRPFEPLEEGRVRLYVCGVTVYDDCHIGHGRAYVVFDVLRRFLEHEGYDVDHVQNFTDVEDKIIERAAETDRAPEAIASEYTRAYFDVMDRLNIKRADVYPTVTGHIPEIIEHVEGLLEKRMAYEVDGSVYFRVDQFEDYGKLSGQDPEEMRSGARVEVEEHKRSPLDFALWKAAEEQPAWESPWGTGRPGWHIECSVMSRTHLGDTLDIHGGGQDLIFPHHENEIAQTEGLTGRPFARTWMHNGFVTVDEEKMSKSEGNFYTLRELYEDFEPAVIRFFILTRHYRSPLDFSFDRLREARGALDRLRTFYGRLRDAEAWPCGRAEPGAEEPPPLDSVRDEFLDAMRSDLNTARALGHLQEWVRAWNRTLEAWETQPRLHRRQQEAISGARAWLETALGEILGLPLQVERGDASGGGGVDDLVEMCLQVRKEAREAGQYEVADAIRERLEEQGFEIEDTPRGPRWERVRE